MHAGATHLGLVAQEVRNARVAKDLLWGVHQPSATRRGSQPRHRASLPNFNTVPLSPRACPEPAGEGERGSGGEAITPPSASAHHRPLARSWF
jgi:hypothetical protein